MPLARIPFARHAYTLDSLPASAQRLLNLYVEAAPKDALTEAVVRPVPGLAYVQTVGTGPCRGLCSDVPSVIFYVSGTQAFRQDASLVPAPVYIGDVVGLGPVTFAASATQMVICAPPYVYCCDYVGPLRLVTNVFANSVCTVDGYFVFCAVGYGTGFFVSRLLDAENIDPLDVANADAVPNTVTRIITHKGQLWILGEFGIEVWYNSGDALFPFARQPGAFLPYGVVGQQAVTIADGSVFWVGLDGIVYRSRGYQVERISTHAVERIILAQLEGRRSQAFDFTSGGHWFVVFSFYTTTLPSITLIYDCSTGLWHERGVDGAAWRGVHAVPSQNSAVYLAGDAANGNIYKLNPLGGPDNGELLQRIATFPPLTAHGPRSFMARLEIEMETGTADPGSILLDWSDDGGRSFVAPRTLPTDGALGNRTRVCATRLGSYRSRTLRVRCTGDATFYGADADIQPGGH